MSELILVAEAEHEPELLECAAKVFLDKQRHLEVIWESFDWYFDEFALWQNEQLRKLWLEKV